MKTCVLFLLVLGSVYGAPVEQGGLQPGSCEDASAVNAAHLALSKINLDRSDGYVFSLHRLSNVNLGKHGETGVVFYLTLDVVETNCSVLSRKDWKECEARRDAEMPVYGQCKATIYINKPHRVVRLYKYNCVVRPVPAARLNAICPDCPTFIGFDSEIVQNTVSQSLEKFNNESGLNNNFALLKILRATAGHESEPHNEPEGMVRMLAAMGQPMTLPSFPDIPAGGPEVGVTLPLKPDPQIPGVTEPTILAYPTSVSAECPIPAGGRSLVDTLFREDPLFKPAA
ncbi:hypothetical protein GOODEAATRI_019901 [Goodea atripinnis]|uniref:Cystatin fetuin-B-type domain-containing protein n=1 Tax=Goodea atripinnis TaxID=208336 RepID=A0ABV0MTS4_9TELE